jgi:hypothetical protein
MVQNELLNPFDNIRTNLSLFYSNCTQMLWICPNMIHKINK